MMRYLRQGPPLPGLLMGHECHRCGREVELPLGEICSECRAEIESRAKRVSRTAALVTTLGLAVYLYFRMPDDQTARLVGLSSVIAWYIIIGLVIKRITREILK